MIHDGNMTTYDTGGLTALRSIPPACSIPWCHLQGVSRFNIPGYYVPTANNVNVWGSITLLILIARHRVQTTEYATVLTNRQPFLFPKWYQVLASGSCTCTSYHTLRTSFWRTAKFQHGQYAIGAERPLLIPGICLYILGIADGLSAPLADRPYCEFVARSKEVRNVWGAGTMGGRI